MRPVVLVAEVQQDDHYLLEAKVAATCDTFEGAGRNVGNGTSLVSDAEVGKACCLA